ncbi:MAG: hypothetical protein ACYC7A_10085 [Thermoanaerobaculia bacterium]
MSLARVALFVLLVLQTSLGLAADAPPINPRQVSQAERAAVEFLVRYLEGDRDAVWNAIEPGSPLHALGRDAAMREIEARLGPPLGAEWDLRTVVPSLADRVAVFGVSYPSGLDDTVSIELSPSRAIRRVTVFAEPSPFADPAMLHDSVLEEKKSEAVSDSSRAIFILGLVGLLIGLSAPLIRLGSRLFAAAALFAGLAMFAGAFTWEALSTAAPQTVLQAEPAAVPAPVRLGALATMRRMMATSNSADAVAAFQQLPQGEARAIAQLWRAQADLNAMRFAETEATLKRFPQGSAVPLVELLRARLAIARSREADAAVAYEHVTALGPGHDGIWGEAANAFWTGGYSDMAKAYLQRMARIGSRDAGVYYVLAQFAVIDGKQDRASECFRAGWQLAPVERAAVLSEPMLWTVLHRQELYPLVALNTARESAVIPRNLAGSPIALRATTTASTSGDQLFLKTSDALLRVPMGSPLAPIGTPAVAPDVLERDEEMRAASDLDALMQSASTAAALTQPVLRRRIEAAASYLARKNDWMSVAKITESFRASSQNVPVDLMLLRAVALRRLRRDVEARTLLTALADGPVVKRRSDPQTLVTLAEMVAALDQFDAAIKLYERADKGASLDYVDDRIRQISTQKRLHARYNTHSTDHFDIRFPEETVPWRAEKVGIILEAELKRLEKWIPIRDFRKTEVQLLPWQEFQSTFAMTENMSGLYDGRIRVPLADIPYLPAEAVAILTHELAHAMIAQATDDRAPHWFQEGLAQRVEMLPYRANSGVMYEDSRYLSTASVDGVLRGYPDLQLIEQAYLESHSIIQYIDARYGTRAIHRMIEQYRAGADTEGAIASACVRPLEAFDREFLQWSRTDAPPVWTATVISYDGEKAPIRLSNPAPETDTTTRKKPVIPDSLKRGAFNKRTKGGN